MKLLLAYITNRGRVRLRNEDALLVGGRVISGLSMEAPEILRMEAEGVLLAVADGMGGMPCGDKASRLVLEFLKDSRADSVEAVKKLLEEAVSFLDRYVGEHPECSGMGTALAGMFLSEGRSVLFNVGDCRVYRFKEEPELLTRDHTEAYELLERGLIDEEGLRRHPLRNVLTSAIMGGYKVDLKVHAKEVSVERGDVFLLCSDGLWDELSREEMSGCLSRGVEEGSLCLLRKALQGGKDNVSFVLFRVL